MNIFKKLLDKLSLTRTEIKVFLFLGAVLLIGSGYKLFFKNDKSQASKEADYSATDSLFKAAIAKEEDSSAPINESVDYKEEVLELNQAEYAGGIKELPAEHSININTADVKELSRLPGIGEKTAKIIVEFRTARGRINKPEDLLDVKGIGESKLNRIIKYIVVD